MGWNAEQRAHYVKKRHNDTVIGVRRRAAQRFYERELARGRTVEQQRAAIEPLGDGERLLSYYRSNGTPRRPLTPRQKRRRQHKLNRAKAA